MTIGASDLGMFFGDFGVPVVFNGVSAMGNLDTPSEMFAHDGPAGMEEDQVRLLLAANAFNPFPLPRQAITVNGQSYTVRDRQFLDDGSLCQLTLKVA